MEDEVATSPLPAADTCHETNAHSTPTSKPSKRGDGIRLKATDSIDGPRWF